MAQHPFLSHLCFASVYQVSKQLFRVWQRQNDCDKDILTTAPGNKIQQPIWGLPGTSSGWLFWELPCSGQRFISSYLLACCRILPPFPEGSEQLGAHPQGSSCEHQQLLLFGSHSFWPCLCPGHGQGHLGTTVSCRNLNVSPHKAATLNTHGYPAPHQSHTSSSPELLAVTQELVARAEPSPHPV